MLKGQKTNKETNKKKGDGNMLTVKVKYPKRDEAPSVYQMMKSWSRYYSVEELNKTLELFWVMYEECHEKTKGESPQRDTKVKCAIFAERVLETVIARLQYLIKWKKERETQNAKRAE